MTAQFLLMCTGYYRYEAGYTPEFVGREDFAGQVVHPQLWRGPRLQRQEGGGDR